MEETHGFYRSVSLFSPNTTSSSTVPKGSTAELIGRILDPNDNLSTNIENLIIGYWTEEEADIQTLCKILESLTRLQSFSWNSTSHIPKEVLRLFHSRFPEARLCVSNLTRGSVKGTPSDKSMDVELLSSPQLYSLEYTVLCDNPTTRLSEFPVLRKVLLPNKNLRILRLGCSSNHRIPSRDYQDQSQFNQGPFNLDLRPGDSFAELNELEFISKPNVYGYQLYDLSHEHCKAWKECAALSKLQKLNLGQLPSQVFFAAVPGSVPLLNSLTFTIQSLFVSRWEPENLETVTAQFLDSILGLEVLRINNESKKFYPKVWLSIQNHGKSLKELTMDVSEYQNKEVPGWAESRFIQLLEHCPRLSTLTIKVLLQKSPEHNANRQLIWPDRPFAKMCNFANLQFLDISMVLPEPMYRQPVLHEDSIREMANVLFCDFFAENQSSELNVLKLKVQRIRPGPFGENGLETVAVKVTRLSTNTVPSLQGGGFESKFESGTVSL